ncbi:hypothetical protein C8Q80DRAFT_376159 [Daedaleopsis nitida]|nr:hypothetical protein C8Q80DRAFT_376159 [Daedaleopsis nitida]
MSSHKISPPSAPSIMLFCLRPPVYLMNSYVRSSPASSSIMDLRRERRTTSPAPALLATDGAHLLVAHRGSGLKISHLYQQPRSYQSVRRKITGPATRSLPDTSRRTLSRSPCSSRRA